MMVTDLAAARLRTIASNVVAAGGGVGGAALVGFGWWAILAAPLTGTVGWLLGWLAGGWLGGRLTGLGFAPPGGAVYRLAELPRGETTAGGKALSLARLVRAGERVPNALVVLPRAFEDGRLTAQAAGALAGELARFPTGQLFAVRSSALAEDSASASFAGAYESVLDVSAADIEAALVTVRGSASAGRVVAYSEAAGAEAGEVAVVVQAMVPAELAGVVFTVDPLTRDLDLMLGSVVHGLGESLVSGSDTGEQFRLHRPSGRFEGPDALAGRAAALHRSAHRIETTFAGVPQDIEWAIADGKLWILQARPITTLNPWQQRTAQRNDSLAGNCLWSATNLSEANPEAQTPLTVSLAAYQQAHGGPSMALRGREMAGSIGGRPYANLSVQVTSRRGKSARTDPREVYQKLAGWWGSLPDGVPIPLIPMTADDWTAAGLPMLGTLAKLVRVRRRLPRFLREHRQHCAALSARIAACTTPGDLRRLWDEELFGFGVDSFWAVIASGSEYPARLEAELRERWGDQDAAALMSDLSGLVDGLESLGPASGLQQVRAGELSREDYLARFGHRGVNETELAWPRPAEDPGWLDRELSRTASGADITTLRARQSAAFSAALAGVADRDPGAVRPLRRKLVRAARHAALRESVRSEGVRTTWVGRRFALRAGVLLGIGDDVFLLTIEELLAALTGDVTPFAWFAERREAYRRARELPPLPGLICGAFDPFAWAQDPDRRSDVWIAGTRASAPRAEGSGVVTGHPGALGRIEGTVRVLDGFESAEQLRPGEILVTSLTNIGWTPLFPIAGGIVTDLGAPLSHAAIVARELGIPAVVGCGDATARLHTGDRVLLDGAAGTVTLLAGAGAPH